MGITGTEIDIPTFTVKSAAITQEETGSVSPAWGSEVTETRLEPLRMRMGCNGEPSVLTLRRLLEQAEGYAPEDTEDSGYLHGKRIRLVDDGDNEWFAGYTGQDSFLIQADPANETHTVTAYGPELRLSQRIVSGQWHVTGAVEDKIFAGTQADADFVRANIYQSDLPVVFNAGNRPNMYDDSFDWVLATGGSSAEANRGCGVFDAPGRKVIEKGLSSPTIEAEFWTAYKALRSLVEWFDDGTVLKVTQAEWTAIETTLGPATRIGQVNVDGLTLPQAIRAVLQPVGFGFCIEPWSETAGSFLHKLHVENLRHAGATVTVGLATKGTGVSDAYAQVGQVKRLDFMRDGHNIRNEVTVLGNQERIQVAPQFHDDANSRDLHPAWDSAEHDLDDYDTSNIIDLLSGGIAAADWRTFAARYHRSGSDHASYRHVFRSFAWNEDGAFSEVIFDGSNNPLIPDLPSGHGVGDGYNCLRRGRPIGPALVWADDNKTTYKPAYVHLWVIVGSNTYAVDITGACEIWTDRAGLTIRGGAGGDLFEIDDQGGFGASWCPFATDAGDSGIPQALQETSYMTLLHNALRSGGTYRLGLTLAGTIEDDKCLRATASKQSSRAMPLLSTRVVRLEQFKKVSTSDDLPGTEDTRDDSAMLSAYATVLRNSGEDELGMGALTIPFVTRTLGGQTLRPLLGVTGTTGRVIDFDVDGGDEVNYPLIRSVTVTFGDSQVTELTLDSNLLGIS